MLEAGHLSGAKTFDPFTADFIRPGWHQKIIRAPAPLECRVYGREWPVGGDCCLWTGWSNGKGHGIVRVKMRRIYLHRYSFQKFFGVELSASQPVDHLCRNRPCFNPWHLEDTTHIENHARGDGVLTQYKPASAYGEAAELTEEEIAALAGDWKAYR